MSKQTESTVKKLGPVCVAARAVWREFAYADWLGLAGAEAWYMGDPTEEDASMVFDPMIADVTVDGHAATAVLDATGIVVMWEVDGMDCTATLRDPGLAGRFALTLPATLAMRDFESSAYTLAGWEVSHESRQGRG